MPFLDPEKTTPGITVIAADWILGRPTSARTLFSDATAATLVSAVEAGGHQLIGPFIYGTDGTGGEHLIVPTGGMRHPRTPETAIGSEDESGNVRSQDSLFMNGKEIFNLTVRTIPGCVNDLLERANLQLEALDLFVFHQANEYILEHVRKRLKIPGEVPASHSHCRLRCPDSEDGSGVRCQDEPDYAGTWAVRRQVAV